MRFTEFKKILSGYPSFSFSDLQLFLGNKYKRSILNEIKRWEKKTLLIKLRRGAYLFGDYKINDPAILAGKIYSPSYISLEYALGHYGIIPEMVFAVTSVTTRTTRQFHNQVGHYYYHTIKKDAFGGYIPMVKDGISYYLASPEKALVDFLYFNRNKLDGTVGQFESYRFMEDYRWKKGLLLTYAKLFLNKKTLYLTKKFIETYYTKKGE